MENKDAALTLAYLHSRLKLAEQDVALFSALIHELKQLESSAKTTKTNNDFLKLVHKDKDSIIASQSAASIKGMEDT